MNSMAYKWRRVIAKCTDMPEIAHESFAQLLNNHYETIYSTYGIVDTNFIRYVLPLLRRVVISLYDVGIDIEALNTDKGTSIIEIAEIDFGFANDPFHSLAMLDQIASQITKAMLDQTGPQLGELMDDRLMIYLLIMPWISGDVQQVVIHAQGIWRFDQKISSNLLPCSDE